MKFFLALVTILPIFANAESGTAQLLRSQNQFREFDYLVSSDGSNALSGPGTLTARISGTQSVDCHVIEIKVRIVPVSKKLNFFLAKFEYVSDGLESFCAKPKELTFSSEWQKVSMEGPNVALLVPEGTKPEIASVEASSQGK